MWRSVLVAVLVLIGCDASHPTPPPASSSSASPRPSAAAVDPHARECARGGLSGARQRDCARFLAFLATPPRCPERPRITAPSYGRCPSEAKVLPRHMGTIAFDKPADPVAKSVISAAQASLRVRLCYAAALVDAPKLAGRVRLSLVVDRLGRLQSVSSAGSALGDPLALECFVREIAELRVADAPVEPRTVAVTFSLEP